jgi:small-conductance mechanosensitive channel
LVTPHSTPGEGGQPEPQRDGGSSPEPGDSGPSGFLVDHPTGTRASAEELSEAVRSLIRERDYLREVRDVQMADSISRTEELTQERDALLQERDTWRDRAGRAEEKLARSLSGRLKRALLWLLRRDR